MRLVVVARVLATAFLAAEAAEALASTSNCPCDAYSNHSVLMDFYYATQGPNWSPNNPSNITGWGTSNPVCEWTGLSCQGNLLVMDLLSLELNGTVPYLLWADLGNLGKITFSSHWLSPPDFAGATSLTAIVMWGGSRSMTLPEAWAQVPNLASITVLQTTLRHLPQTWGAMPKLSYLDLANTEPGGYLPDSWSGMTGLQVLDLSGNFMKGPLPASWSAMTQLQYIDLSDNYFTGPIPSLWSSMTQLRQFRMDTNKLTGELPAWLGGNPYLTTVRLGMNSFTGSLPDSWSHATALTTIHLDWNQLTGPLPLSWGRLARLQTLWLYENQLSGPLPGTWNSMISLSSLSLAHNQISGPIPATWYSLMHRNFNCAGQSEGCKTFALNNNALTGTPDLCLFAQLNMTFHWFNNNNFTGMPDISCFPNGCASQRVQTVFSGNQFCGECFEPTCNCTELQGQTIAVDHSMAIAEVNSAGDCCLNCQNTPGCVAGVFFSAASVNYCNLKNVSTPLVNKPGYTVLLWP